MQSKRSGKDGSAGDSGEVGVSPGRRRGTKPEEAHSGRGGSPSGKKTGLSFALA